LTKKGERALAQGMPLWEQAQEIVKQRLGAARAERLHAELDAAIGALDGIPSS
jgi:hypothetical protein